MPIVEDFPVRVTGLSLEPYVTTANEFARDNEGDSEVLAALGCLEAGVADDVLIIGLGAGGSITLARAAVADLTCPWHADEPCDCGTNVRFPRPDDNR